MGLRFLALACLVGAALAGPVQRQDEGRCDDNCPKTSNPKFKEYVGKTLVYDYRTENNVSIAGIKKDNVSIKATVEITYTSTCGRSIRLKDIEVDQKLSSAKKRELKSQLEVDLAFTDVDGLIQKVCPSSLESEISLNIKKGVLSAFVNAMPRLDKSVVVKEKDFMGECKTNYTVTEKGIKKEKDLTACLKRNPMEMPVENRVVCWQKVEDRTIKSSVCYENKTVGLNDKNLVSLKAKLNLTLIAIKPAERRSVQKPVNQEDISYSPDKPRQGDSNWDEVKQLLKKRCPGKHDIVPPIYTSLKKKARSFSYEQHKQIYTSLQDGTLCSSKKLRDMYIDVLSATLTDAAIKLRAEISERNEANGLKDTLWLASLALKRDPTGHTIEAACTEHLMNKRPSTPVRIACSSMIRRVCSGTDCSQVSSVNQVVEILKGDLDSDDDEKILDAAKWLGDMGYLGKAKDSVVSCVQDSSKPTQVRLYCVDAFRQTDEIPPPELLKVFRRNEDTEVKVALIKILMEKSDRKQIRDIKRILERETDEQLLSYAQTLLKNMKKSSKPSLQLNKKEWENYELNQPKGIHMLSSRNIDLSTYNKQLGIGGSVGIDTVHSAETKLPVSIRTIFGVDYHDQHYDVFEAKLRTEGFTQMLENIIQMKDKIPSIEKIRDNLKKNPTLENLKSQLKHLVPEKLIGDKGIKVSSLYRMMGIEVLSLSTDDLSNIHEILKIAELLSKMARGKDADISHSFSFLDSKFALPSITGTHYYLHVKGSSTVGVTAKAKADMLNLPQIADLHFHLKPSMHAEISTTVGIGDNSHKHVSHMQFESDLEFKAEVREGRILTAKMIMPSENIAVGKISSEILEGHDDHDDKSVFKSMQKKIDYCASHLEKPFGISACAKLEIPKPFMIERPPYALPFGSVEVALKRPDVKSVEFSVELPKKSAPVMRFKIDTPGSKVSRKFEAVAQLKQKKDEKHLLVDVTTPWKTVGASVSLTNNGQRTGVSVEAHNGERPVASASVSCNTISSRSRTIYEISSEYSILNKEPSRIDGVVTAINGRKKYWSFDIKTKHYPYGVKGTFVREGSIGKGEWKWSSDISSYCPYGNWTVRQTIEKRSKQSQAISGRMDLKYKLKGKQEHSFAISGTTQISANKININAKSESSQYSKANMGFEWEMRKDSERSYKNDMKLKWEPNPGYTYIQLKQKIEFPKSGPGMCSSVLDIPHRNIHHEVKFVHDIDLKSEQPKLNIGVDICPSQNKHTKFEVDFSCASKSPMKAKVKFTVESPLFGQHILEDEIEETDDNIIDGKVKYTYIKGQDTKSGEINYKYKKLSKDSKVHHEIESSIRSPFSRSPIESKASFEFSSEALAIVGQVGPDYSVRAHLKEHGESKIDINTPMFASSINVDEKDTQKSIKAAITSKGRRIQASAMIDSGDKKKLEVILQPNPKGRIYLYLSGEKKSTGSRETYEATSKLEVFDRLHVSLEESGDVSFWGDHKCTLKISKKNQPTRIYTLKRETGEERGKTEIAVSENGVVKLHIDSNVELTENRNQKEVSVGISLTSDDHTIDDTLIQVKSISSRSGSSQIIKTDVTFTKNGQVYKTEWNSDIQPTGLEVKAGIQTPHVNYEKSAVGFSVQVSESSVSSSVNIHCFDNKKISVQSEIKSTPHGLNVNCKLSLPSENVKDVTLQATLENHHNQKDLEASVFVNQKQRCHMQWNMKKSYEKTEINGTIKLSNTPLELEKFSVRIQSTRSSMLAATSIQTMNKKEYSFASEIKGKDDVISATVSATTPSEKMKNAKLHLSVENKDSKRSILWFFDHNSERKGDAELSIRNSPSVELKGRFKISRSPELSVHVKCEKTEESSSLTIDVKKGTSPLLSSSFNKMSYHGGDKLLMKTKSFENTLFDLEMSREKHHRNSNKYHLAVNGPSKKVHITIIPDRKERDSAVTEIRACSEERSSPVCYNTKIYREPLNLRLEVTKSSRGSLEHVAKGHVSMSEKMVKAILELRRERKLGFEVNLHQREHEEDRCSLNGHVYLLRKTSRFSASILHNERKHHINLEVLLIPNIDNPSRKLGFEIKKEFNHKNQETLGFMKVLYPSSTQPVVATYKYRPVGNDGHSLPLYYVKLALHSGPVFGNVMILEAIPDIEHEAYGIRCMEYRLKTEAEDGFNATYKTCLKSSGRVKAIETEYSISKQGSQKKGSFAITLSHSKDGNKNLKIAYLSPSSNYEVEASAAEGPNDFTFSVGPAGRKNEINIKFEPSCATLVYKKSSKPDDLLKAHVCVDQTEGDKWHLLKAKLSYQHHDCVDIRVTANPENPDYVDVVFKCNDDESCQALKEMFNIDSLLHGRSLEQIKQDWHKKLIQLRKDLSGKLRQLNQDVVEPTKRKLKESFLRHKQNIFSQLKSKYQKHEKLIEVYVIKMKKLQQDIVDRVDSVIPPSIKKAYRSRIQDLRRKAEKCIQIMKEKVNEILPQLGFTDEDLREAREAFEKLDHEKAKKFVDRKVMEIKETFGLRLIWPSDVFRFIKDIIKAVEHKVVSSLGGIVGKTVIYQFHKYVEKMEKIARQKAIDGIDVILNKFHDIFSQDEDIRTAKKMILDARDEIVNAWRNREEIVESSARKMESQIRENLENFKSFANKQIQVTKYDPKAGEYVLKVHQPLRQSYIQNITKKVKSFIRKVAQFSKR